LSRKAAEYVVPRQHAVAAGNAMVDDYLGLP